jgi:hypothetical protein
MTSLGKAAAIFGAAISVSAFLLALAGGSILYSTEALLRVVGLRGDMVSGYPLGRAVLLIYTCGLAAALAGIRWPAASGLALLPLGAIAFLFGGPVAKVFAVAIACAGMMLLISSRRTHAPGRAN